MPFVTRFPTALVSLTVTLLAVPSCADLKTAPPTEPDGPAGLHPTPAAAGADGLDGGTKPADAGNAADADGATPPASGTRGALPLGYCCAADDECRYGHCVDAGSGTRMCMDECVVQSTCRRKEASFTCDGTAANLGLCRPPAGFACLPASSFTRGTRGLGACCAATGDGNAGEECEGNLCVGYGDGPYICTHRCTRSDDCAAGFACDDNRIDGVRTCIPGNTPYTCK